MPAGTSQKVEQNVKTSHMKDNLETNNKTIIHKPLSIIDLKHFLSQSSFVNTEQSMLLLHCLVRDKVIWKEIKFKVSFVSLAWTLTF